MIPETPPASAGSRPADLSDAEFAELDALLHETPEPLVPLDAVMVDGFLCGVLVQPTLLETPDWLPRLFDEEGRALPETVDSSWAARVGALVVKRHAALRRAIVEDGWFEPLLYNDERDDDLDTSDDREPASDDATDPSDPEPGPIERALLPWVAGFMQALEPSPPCSRSPTRRSLSPCRGCCATCRRATIKNASFDACSRRRCRWPMSTTPSPTSSTRWSSCRR